MKDSKNRAASFDAGSEYSMDKGNLSSRENGYVGGNMTKKMVAYAEQAMSQGQDSAVNSSAKTQFPR